MIIFNFKVEIFAYSLSPNMLKETWFRRETFLSTVSWRGKRALNKLFSFNRLTFYYKGFCCINQGLEET